VEGIYVPAGKSKSISKGNPKNEFPYKKYQSHPLWPEVERAIHDLQVNQDIDLTTAPGYVVGYLVMKIVGTKSGHSMNYFSARLLMVCLVDDDKPMMRNICDRPVIVFRARDDTHAFKRSLEFGKQQEIRYKNRKGQWVRWAFVRVENITRLGRSLDGVEVGSLLDVLKTKRPIPFKKRFSPQRSKPNLD
jgi:hypothetical protein